MYSIFLCTCIYLSLSSIYVSIYLFIYLCNSNHSGHTSFGVGPIYQCMLRKSHYDMSSKASRENSQYQERGPKMVWRAVTWLSFQAFCAEWRRSWCGVITLNSHPYSWACCADNSRLKWWSFWVLKLEDVNSGSACLWLVSVMTFEIGSWSVI